MTECRRGVAGVLSVEDLGNGLLRVGGEIDLSCADELERHLSAEDCPILLDLSSVQFMDANAVRILLRHRKRCAELGKELRLVAMSPAVDRVLRLAGVRALLRSGMN